MFARKLRPALLTFPVLFGLLTAGGCARQPPSRNSLSGKRLRVTVRFGFTIDPLSSYYFLINNANDLNAPGPVPVLLPPYGNGFATGPAGQVGFTDFVVFSNEQPQGYAVRHVIGAPEEHNFTLPVRPITFTPPDFTGNNTQTANQLRFEIDLTQLIFDANGVPLTDQAEAVNRARSIVYLQVNFVATNIVPIDVTTPVNKWVDSFGDNRDVQVNSSWLTIDVSQAGRVYSSTDTLSASLGPEPSDSDVLGADYERIDIKSWTIEVIDTGG